MGRGSADRADGAWRSLKRYADRHLRAPGESRVAVPVAEAPEQAWLRELAALLCAVGVEMLRAGTRTEAVAADLGDIAARYGTRARSFVVPTGLFVRVGTDPDGAGAELDFAPVSGPDLRLDQVQALQDLVERMRAEEVPLKEAWAALERERSLPQRFSPTATVAGHTLLTVGLGVVLHAMLPAVVGYAVLGAAVGMLRLVAGRFLPAAAAVLPVAAAIMVTGLALSFAGPVLHESPSSLVIAPLIAFLPGAALTMGAIELATGDVLSGVARLAGAANVLMLLALGILVGTEIVDPAPVGRPAPHTLGAWAGWSGVLLMAVGFTLFFSAPARTLGWLAAALLLVHLAQTVGTAVGGAAFGAFAAGMLLPPPATWVARHRKVPDQVVFLPCFWLLVPGSSGLTGFSELLLKHTAQSLVTLVTTLVTVAAIALGVLVGAGLQRRTRLEVAPAPDRPGRRARAQS
ncbi:threonine/serine exporter ThrE family protein [Kitasatospora sp. NPDC048365]|uniref:threonine/serine ThrE exporter family protein n=1 Tax=Kitasatospora sp. NPDC048365 TaxID=3364050 RepID=UPI0037216D02